MCLTINVRFLLKLYGSDISHRQRSATVCALVGLEFVFLLALRAQLGQFHFGPCGGKVARITRRGCLLFFSLWPILCCRIWLSQRPRALRPVLLLNLRVPLVYVIA